jgi:Cu/Ag efflux pump CusA
MEFVVRGIGLVNSLDDLKRIVVRSQDGLPIYLEDIAEISVGGIFAEGPWTWTVERWLVES